MKSLKVFYPAIFTAVHDKKDTYLVFIPDLNGTTEGYGLVNAMDMARDYIGCALYSKGDEELPTSSSLTSIDVKSSPFCESGESFAAPIDLDLEAYRRKMNKKSVRRNVSIPLWLDKAAKDARINVSRVLQDALLEKLNIHH